MSIAKPDGVTFKPTLVLVGTRLGIDKVNPVYWEALKSALQMPQSLGIAGYEFRVPPFSGLWLIAIADGRPPLTTSLAIKAPISST